MKGFWKFASFILTGCIAGIILANKLSLGVDTVFKGTVKVKQKGKGNELTVPITVDTGQETRKSDRILSKLERQKARAQKKIDKQHD